MLQQVVVPLRRYTCCSSWRHLCVGTHVEHLQGVEACCVVPGWPRVEAATHAAAGGVTFVSVTRLLSKV